MVMCNKGSTWLPLYEKSQFPMRVTQIPPSVPTAVITDGDVVIRASYSCILSSAKHIKNAGYEKALPPPSLSEDRIMHECWMREILPISIHCKV